MPYKKYDNNPFDDYQGYDQYGSDIEALMNRLIGQQKMIQSTLKDEVDRTMSQITQTADEIRQEVWGEDEYTGESISSKITQNASEIDIRVRQDDVISSINLSPETIQIQSENIDLVGAVTVLSDITGSLGTITAGTINGVQINSANIDITESLYVGDQIWLRYAGTEPIIYFDNNSPDPPYVAHWADGGLQLMGNVINITSGDIWFRGSFNARLRNPAGTSRIEYNNYEILNTDNWSNHISLPSSTGNAGAHSHGGSTGNAGSHNHGLIAGRQIRMRDPDNGNEYWATYSAGPNHSHSISSQSSHSHSI